MTQPAHDIYRTRDTPSHGKSLFRDGNIPADERYLHLEHKRKRRQAFITGFVVLLVASLLIVVGVQQYLLNTTSLYDPSPAPPTNAPAPAPQTATSARSLMTHLALDADAQTRLLLEEIEAQAVGEAEIGEGDKPLHAHWIKEAAYYLLRAERARGAGDEALALESYEKALRIYPDLRGVYATLGMLYMDRAEYEAAAAALERATLEEALSFGIVNNLGVAYLQLEQWDRAEEYLQHALRLRPDYAAAHFNLATLYVRQGNPENAADHFDTFLRMDPEHLNALLVYSSILMQSDEWARAANFLQRAAQLSPESPPIYFRLAQSLAQSERPTEALRTLHQAVELVDARNALAWMSQSEFDRLRHNPEFQQLVEYLVAAQ